MCVGDHLSAVPETSSSGVGCSTGGLATIQGGRTARLGAIDGYRAAGRGIQSCEFRPFWIAFASTNGRHDLESHRGALGSAGGVVRQSLIPPGGVERAHDEVK